MTTRISAGIVGVEVGPIVQAIDPRWVQAYAAGLGETDPRYYDTRASAGPAVHPLFAVCYEWPVALMIRAKTIDAALASLSVHATHRTRIHRPPRAGDTLSTSAKIVSVSRRRGGTMIVSRFTTIDDRGDPVTTTDYGSVYRGVECDGEAFDTAAEFSARRSVSRGAGRAQAGDPPVWTEVVDVRAEAAHVYTECARIWNPIHTDIAAATKAGLPGLILHGTATLALTVSRVIARELGGDPRRVAEIGGRFTGMVLMPSRIAVRCPGRANESVAFDAVDADGRPVLSDGWLGCR
jgi:acyl dehydratase